jgi:glyoxalase family protein
MSILGIHHVTAIAGNPQRNLDFYTRVLGLRFVKRTVNFDDPGTYHFYFGDEVGTPGSILTFFPWPGAQPGRAGPGQVAITSFAALPGSLGFWIEQLMRHQVVCEGPTTRGPKGAGAERVLSFRDPDGLLLEIVGHDSAASRPAWEGAPGVPGEHALRGFHEITMWVESWDATERLLVDTLGFRPVREDGTTRRYAVGDGGASRIVDVRATGGFLRGVESAGTVHHVAWNVADDAVQRAVRQRVDEAGRAPTPVIDRKYFRSVYFREPGGVLFELATAGPGFAVDEPADRLGERLMLPEAYEPRRGEIEHALPPLHLAEPAPADRSA